MSLEDQLAANTAAVVALTAALVATAKLAPVDSAATSTQEAKADTAKADTGKAGKGKAAKAEATETKAAGMTADELTAVIVSAVKTHGRETVLKVLKDDFGVAAGKEITDPAVRKQLADKLAALASGEDDLS